MRRALALAMIAAIISVGTAGATSRDRTPPTVRFTTQDEAVLVGAPADHELATVNGTSRDTGSGVRAVFVTYCTGNRIEGGGWVCSVAPIGHVQTIRARLTCSGATCSWRAAVPAHPGNYLVFAKSNDWSANVRTIGPIEVLVL